MKGALTDLRMAEQYAKHNFEGVSLAEQKAVTEGDPAVMGDALEEDKPTNLITG